MKQNKTIKGVHTKSYNREHFRRLLRIGKGALLGLGEELIRRGKINAASDRDHLSVTIAREIEESFSRAKRGSRIRVAIDYSGTLLKEAKHFARRGNHDLALLLYATWIEHFVNGLIECAARRKGLHYDDIPALIRDTPLKAKVGWLLPLLELPQMVSARQKHIDRIMQLRNAFVHYKWSFHDIDDQGKREQTKTTVSSMPGLISYLKRFEQKHILRHSRRQLLKLIEAGIVKISQRDNHTVNLPP